MHVVRLQNGLYYNIDTDSSAPDRIMADQLAGEWYAKACGLPPVVPEAHALSAFRTIHANNFKKFDSGAHGVVNVMTAGGVTDPTSEQTREVWVGTSFAVAAGMVQEGLVIQANEIGQSLHDTIWQDRSLWFRTPEAWSSGVSSVRATTYMRANAIWAVKRAIDIAPSP